MFQPQECVIVIAHDIIDISFDMCFLFKFSSRHYFFLEMALRNAICYILNLTAKMQVRINLDQAISSPLFSTFKIRI
jgi:hypothetical protein